MKSIYCKILTVLVLVSTLICSVSCGFDPSTTQGTDDSKNTTQTNASIDNETQTQGTEKKSNITGFTYVIHVPGVSLEKGETDEYTVLVDGTTDFNIDEIEFISSNESAVTIEFLEQNILGWISFKITAISEGVSTVYVQTKDGSVKSKEIQVSVTDPNNYQYEIVDNYYFTGTNSIGVFWMDAYVVVKNTGTTNIYLSNGTFDVEDSNGHLVKSQSYVNVYPEVIAPNETAVYHTQFSLDNGSSSETYKIIPKLNIQKATVDLVRFDVTDTEITKDSYGYIKITGRVQNTSTKEESLYPVVAILYDANEKVIGIMYTYPDKLAPGEKIGFEMSNMISYNKIDFDDIKTYKVIAYPTQYQFQP